MREFFGDTIPEKVVVVSGFRYANSRMAGGDFDGGLNMLCFHPTLLRLIRETEELPGLQTQREEQRQEQEEDPGATFKVI